MSEHKQSPAQLTEEQQMDETKATFLEHLEDLRDCVIRAFLGILAGAAICFLLFEPIYSLLTAPYHRLL